jgi:hypothetical protein
MPTYTIQALLHEFEQNPNLILTVNDTIDLTESELASIPASTACRLLAALVFGNIKIEEVSTAFIKKIEDIASRLEQFPADEKGVPDLVKSARTKLRSIERNAKQPEPGATGPIERKLALPSSMPATAATSSITATSSTTVPHYDIISALLERTDVWTDGTKQSEEKAGRLFGNKARWGETNAPFFNYPRVYFSDEFPTHDYPHSYYFYLPSPTKYELYYIDHNKNAHPVAIRKIPGLEPALRSFHRHLAKYRQSADPAESAPSTQEIREALYAYQLDTQITCYAKDTDETIWYITKYHPSVSPVWHLTCTNIKYQNYHIDNDGFWYGFFAVVDHSKFSSKVGIKIHITCAYTSISAVLNTIFECQTEAKKIGSTAFNHFKAFARSNLEAMKEDKAQGAKVFSFQTGSDFNQIVIILDMLVERLKRADIPANGLAIESDTPLPNMGGLATVRNDMGRGLFRFINATTVEFVGLVDDSTRIPDLALPPPLGSSNTITYKVLPVYVRLSDSSNDLITIHSIPFRKHLLPQDGTFDFSQSTFQKNIQGQLPFFSGDTVYVKDIPRKGPLDSPGGYFSFTRSWDKLIQIPHPIPAPQLHVALRGMGLLEPVADVERMSLAAIILERLEQFRNPRASAAAIPSAHASASSTSHTIRSQHHHHQQKHAPAKLPALPLAPQPDGRSTPALPATTATSTPLLRSSGPPTLAPLAAPPLAPITPATPTLWQATPQPLPTASNPNTTTQTPKPPQ